MEENLFESAMSVEQEVVLELLKSFPLDSLVKFRHGEGYCYAHETSGVGYKCSLHFEGTSVTYKAEPGVYFPQPLPPKD